ncbi:polysaccharide deacetylase family protein [Mangrovibacterium diazotrophicum]|uniref:Peptidoglycan/xylan/chitin deacetylase (PgdA/CDA1 family) n=1 Tax=Mangrovibacterium diazotrophicum TaxID=1261403 RepID=A0A419WAD7_9BACT|nr:polysaccharide deacetylase family protein [Mangrovibacterium diazotrophicum]RKD92440.1 peptidoglycan/xylan/chitin deacetylase (PgdA/CDA1 family) [Mangrovibacterium diazotrophicum]
MHLVHPRIRLPWLLTRLFPGAVFRVKTSQKEVFLTFDDGPVPEVTPWVLELLKREKLKACFFCVGENVQRNPELFQRVQDEGHLVGNHTFNHMQGLKNDDPVYYANVEKAAGYIPGKLFRPPHGLLRIRQFNKLKADYRFIMWDIISCDFDKRLSPQQVGKNVLRNARPGSVIIFHDSIKAEKNMKQALPLVIKGLQEKGFKFGDPHALLGITKA